MTILLLLLIG